MSIKCDTCLHQGCHIGLSPCAGCSIWVGGVGEDKYEPDNGDDRKRNEDTWAAWLIERFAKKANAITKAGGPPMHEQYFTLAVAPETHDRIKARLEKLQEQGVIEVDWQTLAPRSAFIVWLTEHGVVAWERGR